MHRLRTIALTFLLFTGSISQAQKKAPGSNLSATLSLPVIPGPNFDVGIQPGLQINFPVSKIAWLTELGFKVIHPDDSAARDHQYFRVKSELKYFTSKGQRKSPVYIAIEIAYARRAFTSLSGGYYFADRKNKDNAFYYDEARIKSPIFTAACKGGWEIFLNTHLRLDVSSGLGFRNINTTFSEIVNLREDNFNANFRLFTPAYRFKGTLSRLHFTTGIRIAYRF